MSGMREEHSQCACDRLTVTEFRHTNENEFPRSHMAAEQRGQCQEQACVSGSKASVEAAPPAVSAVLRQDPLLLTRMQFDAGVFPAEPQV